jgi:ABC-2 type transport system ATP-binding protein
VSETLGIEASGLTKSYGPARVLDGIDLHVPAGSVLALLGPNGAGKTTTVRILATLTRPDAGTARVAGHDVLSERHQVRRRISLTGQSVAIDELQTGAENLAMVGRLRRLPARAARARAGELLDRFDLAAAAHRLVSTYSGGMRRRLDLAAGLIGHPEVIFLDEPTTGLDPLSRRAVWGMVSDLTASGVTILLTTQYLDEADHLADHVAVLDHGRIVALGTPDQLKRQVGGRRLEMELADAAGFDAVTGQLGPRAVDPDPSQLSVAVAVEGGAAEVRMLLDQLDPARSRVARFAISDASLDDVFAALTGRRAATPEPETSDV